MTPILDGREECVPKGDLEEQVYMVQPPGIQSELNKSAVCRLKKSLYGLTQAQSLERKDHA